MNKKIFISVFLCLFLLSFVMLAKERLQVIEHVFWDEEVWFNETDLPDSDFREYESAGPLFTFLVPPSPESEAIFFDFGCQSSIWWYGKHKSRVYWSTLKIKISSEVIPANMIVYTTLAMESVTHETLPMNGRPTKTTYKLAMRRDDILRENPWWYVKYVQGGDVPPETASNVKNGLIDNGFDVEVSVIGRTEGVEGYVIVTAWIHVTRATQK